MLKHKPYTTLSWLTNPNPGLLKAFKKPSGQNADVIGYGVELSGPNADMIECAVELGLP